VKIGIATTLLHCARVTVLVWFSFLYIVLQLEEFHLKLSSIWYIFINSYVVNSLISSSSEDFNQLYTFYIFSAFANIFRLC
tara:strand:+ start:376 stop:618 length:243 start_codon:yes stop_codon:yes gene_type:complete